MQLNLDSQTIEQLLQSFDLGELSAFAHLETRVATTLYRLRTSKRDVILTIFDDDPLLDMDFILTLRSTLKAAAFPCADVYTDKAGRTQHSIAGSTAIMAEYLPGAKIALANAEQITALGHLLGQLHVNTVTLTLQRENHCSDAWRSESVEPLLDILSTDDALLLQEEMGYASRQDFAALPKGIIHGHVSPDHVLFDNNTCTGLIDFYYACYDCLLLDVAIAVNHWCHDGNGQLDQLMVDFFIQAYQQHRPLTKLEHHVWPAMRQIAALQFWILQLKNNYFPAREKCLLQKDPDEYKIILQQVRNYDHIIKA